MRPSKRTDDSFFHIEIYKETHIDPKATQATFSGHSDSK